MVCEWNKLQQQHNVLNCLNLTVELQNQVHVFGILHFAFANSLIQFLIPAYNEYITRVHQYYSNS